VCVPEDSQLGDSNIFGNGEKTKFNIEPSLTDDSLRNQTTNAQGPLVVSDSPSHQSDTNAIEDAIQILLGGGRLNDNAVTLLRSLLWESGKAGREMAVLDSFEFLSPSWSIRKIQRFKETYTATKQFLIPIHDPKDNHWTLALIDFDEASIQIQTAIRFSCGETPTVDDRDRSKREVQGSPKV
jgi:hypothetical protein